MYPEMPDDEWHRNVYVLLCPIKCWKCERDAHIEWAWDGLDSSEESAQKFTMRAVPHLKSEGWALTENGFQCPECTAKGRETGQVQYCSARDLRMEIGGI
jgi:hypothetical protein